MSRIKRKRLRGSWGTYKDGEIVLDKQLQNIARPSKPAVYFHEEYHKYIDEKGIDLEEQDEELKCEIYSLMRCVDSELSFLERYLKEKIISKYGKLSKLKILKMNKFI